MSGGGGGGYFPSEETTDCRKLTIKTQLASPNPTVITSLSVGVELEVVLIPPTGPVQVVTTTGEVAGALLPVDLAQLIQCIAQGFEYKAKVLAIVGGNCEVLITAR